MQHLNGVYTQAFNRGHIGSGHLLQGRYKAILIEREAHLLELGRYIVLNPVRARLCTHPAEFPLLLEFAHSRKPMDAWVASQNGLFLEAPQRQSVTRLRIS